MCIVENNAMIAIHTDGTAIIMPRYVQLLLFLKVREEFNIFLKIT